ncbi:Chloroperoxidase [Coprinopsis sp. MPI-PUGE-AT-0042]|nr:Chloroperoxidase [Coprinopsis sp. MPI-PUGE-AT-0042]
MTVQALPPNEALAGKGPARPPLRPVYDLPLPPPNLAVNGTKLVNDAAHPYRAPRPGDMRGPCPGLNTLANHGYLPRDGIASPRQIIIAAQEGFNQALSSARTAVYAGHLLNGNLEYDLLSIGGKTPKTGPNPPAPALVAGLSQHATFEGDASMTRADAFFGDNVVFNPALFEQFKNFSMIYGNGFFNHTVAAELRYHRIQQSIANNPNFDIRGFRHTTVYGEAALPGVLFVDGRATGAAIGQLDLVSAELFFKDNRFPEDFHRAAAPSSGSSAANMIFNTHPTEPGRNVNGVNTYEADLSRGGHLDRCSFYKGFIENNLKSQYPNPKGLLRRNLNKNLEFFYASFEPLGCERLYPYGQD